jgi:squalene monooxygenase
MFRARAGGMTVALNDVVLLTNILAPFLQKSADHAVMDDAPHTSPSSLSLPTLSIDWDELSDAMRSWHWSRKGLSSTINILSVALYDLFGADGSFFVWEPSCAMTNAIKYRHKPSYPTRRMLCIF